MGDLLQFVDEIDATPTVLLDLNDEDKWSVRSFDPPTARLRRTVSQNVMRDGGFVSSSQYEMRTLPVGLELITDDQDTNATEIQKLARILDKPTSILKWQPTGATAPVFFTVYRSDISAVVNNVAAKAYRDFTVELLADPAALGLAETIGPITIDNDPAAVTNPCFYRIGTGIKGDLAAPLNVLVGADTDLSGRTVLLSSQALSSGSQTAPVVIQDDDFTTAATGAAWSAGTADAAMSEGTYSRITATAAAGTASLTIEEALPATLVGDYRVLIRLRSSGAVAAWSVRTDQLMVAASGGAVMRTGDTVNYVRGSSGPHWIDTGIFRFPFGAPALSGGYPSSGLTFRHVFTTPASVGQTLDVDCVMLIPVGVDDAVSTTSLFAGFGQDAYASLATHSVVFDHEHGVIFALNGSGEYTGTGPTPGAGAMPVVVPGADNSLHFLRHTGTGHVQFSATVGSADDDITRDADLTFTYHPHYIYTRPATT